VHSTSAETTSAETATMATAVATAAAMSAATAAVCHCQSSRQQDCRRHGNAQPNLHAHGNLPISGKVRFKSLVNNSRRL
jgi:hypothetical protein